ncbi:histidine phosphatase family protein [Streptococcus dentasini]
MATRLYLMRHGQTLFNVQERIQGWSDSPLTDLGIEQARQAGQYFKEHGMTFDRLYCSTSERASDTLELVTGATEYTRLKGIKEMNFGRFEGQQEYLHPPHEVRRAVGNYYVVHGGESDSGVQQRVKAAVTQIAQDNDGRSVLAVSHAGALMHFMRAIGIDFEKYGIFPHNCAVFDYTFEAGQFTLKAMIDPLKSQVYRLEESSE